MSLRKTWLAAFGLLLLLSTLWNLATPVGSPADENEHIVKAALVVRGHLTVRPPPGPSTPYIGVTAPKTDAAAIRVSFCYVFDTRIPAGCAYRLPSSMAPVATEIYVGRYQPTYYLLVGLPTLVFSNPLGMYVVRFLSSLWVDALLAWALTAALAFGSRVLFGGVLVGITPMVLYLTGTISPSALEVTAAVAFWVALVLLVRRDTVSRHLVVGAAVSGLVLVLTRPPSPLWALLAVASVLPLLTRARARALLRRRGLQVAGVLVVAGAVAGSLWTVIEHATTVLPGAHPAAHASRASIVRAAMGQATGYVRQAVGDFSINVDVLQVVVLAWLSAAAALAWSGWTRSDRRGRTALGIILLCSLVVPTASVTLAATHYGYIGHGRYFLPLYVGVPILAAALVSETASDRLFVRTFAVLLGAGQVVAFYWCLHRFMVGSKGPAVPWSTVRGGWSPPLPGTVLDVLFLVAVAACVVVVRRAVPAAPPDRGEPNRDERQAVPVTPSAGG